MFLTDWQKEGDEMARRTLDPRKFRKLFFDDW